MERKTGIGRLHTVGPRHGATVAGQVGTVVLLCACAAGTSAGNASVPALHAADSALVGRILVAEDRRDATDRALEEGRSHRDARIRMLATRAIGRIRDPRFAARDSLPPLPAPPSWPEPGWRMRYRSLTPQTDCATFASMMTDPSLPVRLRAVDLLPMRCGPEEDIVAMLRGWVDALPSDPVAGTSRTAAWHGAAHAIVALARLRPTEAGERVDRLAAHPHWQVRMYAASAAAQMSDAERLRRLANDTSDNVRETAIAALARLTGHADDATYIAALGAEGAQAIRAAAIALEGSSHPDAVRAATAAFERLVARGNASERDARVALLEAAGRPASDDRPPPVRVALPPRAVALALGADVRLRVTLAPSSGGGSFIVRLRGDVAPMMASRVLELVNARYYDGLTWHRVEHDFVIQGGSPGANEYVGYREFFRDELGTVPHARGTIGMSTRGHDTGDAQWFVNLKDNLRLGRDYTVFAEVVDGIAVVDGIMEGDVIARIEEVGR